MYTLKGAVYKTNSNHTSLNNMINDRVLGAFYTPVIIADYLVEKTLSHFHKDRRISILEPSCGSGVFLKSIIKLNAKCDITAVEINEQEVDFLKSSSIIDSFKIVHKDYLEFHFECNLLFDLVIGNPPYISYTKLNREQVKLGNLIINESNLGKRSITNIWEPFLISGVTKLSADGVLCYILPVELLQVRYAERLRSYLMDNFQYIELIHFNEPIYKDILQDVIGILCYKKHNLSGFRESLFEVDTGNSTYCENNGYKMSAGNNKWTSSILTKEELSCIETLGKRSKPIGDYVTTKPGIVTGNNNFFILPESEVISLAAYDYVKPIINRSSYVKDFPSVVRRTHEELRIRNRPCLLLDLNGINSDQINMSVKKYIALGESREYQMSYKARHRCVWYAVPNIATAPAVFFKRSHRNIKLLLNPDGLYYTDTAYLVYPKPKTCIYDFVYSFYNSYTLVMAELLGRFYGGGVLELVPSEFQSLPIYYLSFNDYERDLLSSSTQNQVIKYVDNKAKFSQRELSILEAARMKLIARRVDRRNPS